jgi:hypothetical protein
MMTLTEEQKKHREEVDTAFDRAIKDGRLSEFKYEWNYAGNYMYMGNYAGKDQFKNRTTRSYIQ